MTVAFDGASGAATTTGTITISHTPAGTPRGVLVLVAQNVGVTDEVTGATYGGVAMHRVKFTPHPTGSEDGALYAYFLGTGVPTGTQDAVVNVNGTGSSKRGICFTVTATRDTAVENFAELDSAGVANPSVSVTLQTGTECFVAGVLHSGLQSPGDITAGTDCTAIGGGIDFGNQSAFWVRKDAITTTSDTSAAINFTGASEEAGVLAVAIREGLGVANVITGGDATNATSYTTASFNVISGRLYLAAFSNWDNLTTVNTPTATSSGGETVSMISGATGTVNSLLRTSIFQFRASSTGSRTLTFDCAGSGHTQVRGAWSIDAVTGESPAGTFVQANGAGATSTNPLVTLGSSPADAKNDTYGAVGVNNTPASLAPTAGWTEISEGAMIESALTVGTIGKLNSQTASWSVGSAAWASAAVEIKALVIVSGDAALAGSGAVSGSGVVTQFGTAALAGDGAISATGDVESGAVTGEAALTGSGAVNATGVRTVLGSVPIAGNGALAATGGHTGVGTAALAGIGTVGTTGEFVYDVLTRPAGWGTHWFPALDNAENQQVVVVGWGDSITQGYYSSQLHDESFFGQWIADLQAVFGDGGSGFHSVRNTTGVGATGATYITATGTWTTFAQNINETLLMNNTAGVGTIEFPGVRGETIDVWVGRDDALAMSFDIDIDGGGFTTQAVATGADGPVKFSFATTPGTHTVTIRPTSGFFCQILGVSGMNPTGVVGHNMGFAGRGSGAGAVTTGLASGTSGSVSITGFDPDLVVIQVGINDITFATSNAAFQANLERLSDLAADADLAYVIAHRGATTDTNNRYTGYEEVTQDVAETYVGRVYDTWQDGSKDWDVWDLLEFWGIPDSASGDPGDDPVHLSDEGHDRMADQMVELTVGTIHDATATLAGSGALAASGVRVVSGAATLAGAGTVAASGVRTVGGGATLAGSGTVAAAGVRAAAGTAAVAGSGVLAATGLRTTFASAPLVGVGSLVGAGIASRFGVGVLAGVGTLAATGTTSQFGAATLVGVGTLVGEGDINLVLPSGQTRVLLGTSRTGVTLGASQTGVTVTGSRRSTATVTP